MQLRDYQQEVKNRIRNEFKNGNKKVVVSLPTGAGKTAIGFDMVRAALQRGKRCYFIVDRITLLNQTIEVMYENGLRFGVLQADNPLYRPSEPFQIVSAQTLKNRTVPEPDFCIVDEAHVIHKSILKNMERWNKTFFLGLSATPFTKGLGKHWGRLVNGVSVRHLINGGYLCDFVAYGAKEPDLKGVRLSAGDYNKKDLGDRTLKKELIADIVSTWFKRGEDRQTIVAAVNVAHAEAIAKDFQDHDVKADTVHCYMPEDEKKNKIQMFKKGQIKVLTSVDMISRGFDMPEVGCLVLARPTRSLIYHLQLLGRGLRPHPDLQNVIYLDHAGNIGRLGFPDEEHEMILDMNIKKESGKKKKPLPKKCFKCQRFKPVRKRVCPYCGYEAKRQNKVETKDGELTEIKKRKVTMDEKRRFQSELEYLRRQYGYSSNWVAHTYRDKFGVWPVTKDVAPLTPSKATINFVRYRQIKYAKSRRHSQSQ